MDSLSAESPGIVFFILPKTWVNTGILGLGSINKILHFFFLKNVDSGKQTI